MQYSLPLALTEAESLVKMLKGLKCICILRLSVVTLGQLKNIADDKAVFSQEEAKH